MHPFIEKIYFKSPLFLQDAIVSVYGYKLYRERYIGNHNRYLRQLLRSQWYTENEMRELVEQNFNSIIKHAVETVPYYKSLVKEGKLKPPLVNGVSDIDKLPIISKEQVRGDRGRFLSKAFHERDLIVINTSGTTGKSLKIFVDKDSRRLAYAFFSRVKAWAGITDGLPNVTFAGRNILPPETSEPPFWRRNIRMNNYLFSSYHLSQKTMRYYVEKLLEIKPHFIDTYPSSIHSLATYMKENNINGIYPKAIITSAETLLDHQRDIIQEVFRCPVVDQYGCAEQVIFVSQCEKGTYHIHPEFGIVEFLREDGTRAEPGEPARLICTGFTNRAMPLIRYDIGDTAILSEKKCPCGRNFPVIEKIVGRNDDVIVTADGRRIGRFDPIFKGLLSIREAQIVQEDCNRISVKIVAGEGFNKREADMITWEMKKRIGVNIDINVQIVENIPRSAAGKFRAVISNISKPMMQ